MIISGWFRDRLLEGLDFERAAEAEQWRRACTAGVRQALQITQEMVMSAVCGALRRRRPSFIGCFSIIILIRYLIAGCIFYACRCPPPVALLIIGTEACRGEGQAHAGSNLLLLCGAMMFRLHGDRISAFQISRGRTLLRSLGCAVALQAENDTGVLISTLQNNSRTTRNTKVLFCSSINIYRGNGAFPSSDA